jgi:cytidine deaminase
MDDLLTRLAQSARQARKNAYAPYSRFPVGAALLASSGKTYTGCNVENASYGLSLCAERVALFGAIAAGERSFELLAVASAGGGTPCGACRQAYAEFPTWGLEVLVIDTQGGWTVHSLDQLLPQPFRLPEGEDRSHSAVAMGEEGPLARDEKDIGQQ